MARKKPELTAAELAVAPRPEPPPLETLPPRTCRICGVPVGSGSLCPPHRGAVLNLKEERAAAKLALESNAHRYAQLHMAGAEVAAQRGDTRPAEWALLHTRTITPVKTDTGPAGVVVHIGVVLPGLPGAKPLELDVPAVDAEAVEEVPSAP